MNRLAAILPAANVLVGVEATSKSARSSTPACCSRTSTRSPARP
jgi:hypothetical protein